MAITITVSLDESPENLRKLAGFMTSWTEDDSTVDRPCPKSIPPVTLITPERDSVGYLWDARIHSANKEVNTDGRWRQRRNLSQHVREQVEAELRGELPSSLVDVEPPPPSPVVELPPPPPVVEPAPVAPPPVIPSVPFGAALQKIATAVSGNAITLQQALETAKMLGLKDLTALSGRPDLIDPLLQALGLV